MSDSGIVIIGAGDCGARAALELRACGYTRPVTVVTKDDHLPYERPQLSKSFLSSTDEPDLTLIADADTYTSANIDLCRGVEAVAIDRASHVVEVSGGGFFRYDRLLLATGSAPHSLLIEGADDFRVHTLRSVDDARRIRGALVDGSRVVCVGGGFIGLEVAASASQRNAVVTVVEGLPRIMSRVVPAAIAEVAAARHHREGVTIFCNESVVKLDADSKEMGLILDSGRRISADFIVVGIGVTPVTTLAEMAGLQLDNGIAVDQFFATSDPAIFAAGDCCSFPNGLYGRRRIRVESWRSAIDQARLAARSMLGAGEPVCTVPSLWSDQYDLTLEVVGICDEAVDQVRWDRDDETFIIFHLDCDGVLVAASGIGRGTSIARHFRLAERLVAVRARPRERDLKARTPILKPLLEGGGST